MICWHDWDAKDKQSRVFVRKLYGLGWNWLLAIGGVLAVLTVGYISYFQFKTPPDFSSISTLLMTTSCLYSLTMLYVCSLFLMLLWLDTATDWRDKVCRKCHRVVLISSENREKIDAYEEIQSEIKKTLEAQRVNIQAAADESFSRRKASWED